jgi:hypothetical protein
VSEDRKADLRQTISLFESLHDSYRLTRDRLVARRSAADQYLAEELDDRLAANARTIESFKHAVECLREQLASLESHPACGGLLGQPATNEPAGSSREAHHS